MRNVALWIALVVACGPSSSEMSGARTARYKGDKLAMFNAALAATQAKYKVQKADQNALGFQTTGRWYTPDGLAAAESDEDMLRVPDKSLSIAFVVTMRADGDAYIVDIKPLMVRYHAGSPKPEPISEDDPSVPGWAGGKRDQLAFDIHDALKPYEVPSLPGTATAAPAPAPAAAPTPAPAADGSAAAPPSVP
jgi:pilus assembly protein FimV